MGGGLNRRGKNRSQPSESIVWGYQEESFLHNFSVGLPSSVNSTVFQAHYCRGVATRVTSSHRRPDGRTHTTCTVQYSHEQPSDHVCIYSPGGKGLGKACTSSSWVENRWMSSSGLFFFPFVCFFGILKQRHVQCLRGLLWTYC